MMVAAVLCLVWGASPARAQGSGVRAGISSNPDQVFVGGHLDLGEVADNLSFRPNLEVGLGNDLTTFATNVEFVYRFGSRHNPWTPYAGAGPAMNVYVWDRGTNGGNDTDVQPGVNLLFGVEHHRGYFTELKVGLLDSPEVKIVFGLNLRR